MVHDSVDSMTIIPTPSADSTESSELRNQIKTIKGQIIALKKSVTKGDKKRKKEVEGEIGGLEAKLEELAGKLSQVREQEHHEEGGEASLQSPSFESIQTQKFLKKQQKQQAKAAQHNAAIAAAKSDLAHRPRLDLLEREAIQARLAMAGLQIEDVPADGDCMFSAIGRQISRIRGEPPILPDTLRAMAAEHLRKNAEKYACFVELDDPDNGNDNNNSDDARDIIERYTHRLCHDRIWGGHVELDALSSVLDISIWVYQANIVDGRVLEGEEDSTFTISRFNDQDNLTPVRLLYSRYAYSLGEHYDSIY